MISCKQLMGKGYFETHSEFFLALCMGAECGRIGTSLDMSDMRLEKEKISEDEWVYFNYLISIGSIYLKGVEVEPVDVSKVKLYFDVNKFTPIKDKLVDTREDHYYWELLWAHEKYGTNDITMLNVLNLHVFLLHLIAHRIIRTHMGEIPLMPLVITISNNNAKSHYIYVDMYSCLITLPWFKNYVQLDVDWDDMAVGMDYYLFCSDAMYMNHYNHWTVDQKVEIFDKCGIKPGSVMILYTRKGIRKNNVIGHIENAIVAIVNEINHDSVSLTTVALNKTKEELEREFLDIPDDRQGLFIDMVRTKPNVASRVISLYNLGIDNYFYDEDMLLIRIDPHTRVTKYITIDGKTGDVEMSEIDAIYWLMCQHEIIFDRDLYKKMYSPDKDLLWDVYGEDEEEIE